MSNINQRQEYSLRDYYDKIVKDSLEIFKELITWTQKDKDKFKTLLDELKEPFDINKEMTKEKGDRLENLVKFIIKKTYFFEIYTNVKTETNEIDEVIVLSDRGKQAMKEFNISRDLIPISQDLFLGECKNYKSNLGVTYVGKFYSLLSVTGVPFGIIFTQKGLTGDSAGYKDAYGLTKVLRMVEISNKKDFYILTFTLEDYEKMLDGVTFFELVKAKMMEMKLASNYTQFLKDNKHESEEDIKAILKDYK